MEAEKFPSLLKVENGLYRVRFKWWKILDKLFHPRKYIEVYENKKDKIFCFTSGKTSHSPFAGECFMFDLDSETGEFTGFYKTALSLHLVWDQYKKDPYNHPEYKKGINFARYVEYIFSNDKVKCLSK